MKTLNERLRKGENDYYVMLYDSTIDYCHRFSTPIQKHFGMFDERESNTVTSWQKSI